MEKNSITNREDCLKLLNDLAIKYKLHQHDPVFNMEEMSSKLKLEQSPFIKCLLFSDSKKANTHYMVIADMNTKPDKGTSRPTQPTGKKLAPRTTTFV
jgi:hypothetical protein